MRLFSIHRHRRILRGCVAFLAFMGCVFARLPYAAATDPLYATEPGRIEAELEVSPILFEAGSEFDDLDPVVLFGLFGGAYIGDGLRVQAGVRAAVMDSEADHIEALAALGWTWIQPTDMGLAPALRAGARVELGWRWLELHGSDFVVNDDGFTALLNAELGLVVFEDFALLLRAGGGFVMGSNRALPDMQFQVRGGLAFVGSF